MLPRINEILLDVIESGLIDYWTRNVAKDRAAEQGQEEVEKEEKILKLTNLQGGFILWAIGLGLSIVTFLVEICVDKKYPRA